MSCFCLQGKAKYNAWKEISHISEQKALVLYKGISAQKAQALYIQAVNEAINTYGTSE